MHETNDENINIGITWIQGTVYEEKIGMEMEASEKSHESVCQPLASHHHNTHATLDIHTLHAGIGNEQTFVMLSCGARVNTHVRPAAIPP